jgi:hypothetical protein
VRWHGGARIVAEIGARLAVALEVAHQVRSRLGTGFDERANRIER